MEQPLPNGPPDPSLSEPSVDPTGPTPRVVPFPVHPSRIDPDAAKVVRRLTRHGHLAYLVGGCVRDLLLGRTPKDFDIATSARPSEVKFLFRNCRIIGRRFRLAHVLFGGGKVIEVATFRRDPTLGPEPNDDWPDPGTNGPSSGVDDDERAAKRNRSDDDDLLIRQDNAFGDPPDDAARRDFTMNALFYDLDRGEIVDYVNGLAEIERRVIRTIGEPDVRFREDPVRILRAIKFAARLDLALEPDVYDAMVAHRDDLLRAAPARLFEEILRLLRGGAAQRSFWLAWETGVLSVLLPELAAFLDDDESHQSLFWRRMRALDQRVAEGDTPSDAALFALLVLEPAEEFLDGEADPVIAAGDFLEPIHQRVALPRRSIDRLRMILASQRRLRAGRVGALSRRDFFSDAAAVFALDATARGLSPAQIEATLSGRPQGASNGGAGRRGEGHEAHRGPHRGRGSRHDEGSSWVGTNDGRTVER